MDDSILLTIRKMLLGNPYEEAFDSELINAINSIFFILNQLGIGSDDIFIITGIDTSWNDFINDDNILETVKEYIYLKCRLIFDTPNSSSLNSYESMIEELEWRLVNLNKR